MSDKRLLLRFGVLGIAACMTFAVLGASQCSLVSPFPEPNEPLDETAYNNTTDPTNNNASFIGSEACIACHAGQAALHAVHGHAHILNRTLGVAPTYPSQATRAGVPDPPAGFSWDDVSYVIGGYIRKARFANAQGYLFTNDSDLVDTQYNLDYAPTGTQAGFAPYENEGNFSPLNRKPHDYDCFKCHSTGAEPQDPDNPLFLDNLPGAAGSFAEPGVMCEACHGPASNHLPNRFARTLYVGLNASDCGRCHSQGTQPQTIVSKGGYIVNGGQWSELLASGGHSSFSCLVCHDPHTSVNYDRSRALVAACTDCHPNQTMALHQGKVFVRGDYSETLSCESCHMTFATRSAAAAGPAVVGANGRMADMHTHIFRIDTADQNYTAMFTADGSEVVRDADGRAAVTVDFVCLRCHSGVGNAFGLTVNNASFIAEDMHAK